MTGTSYTDADVTPGVAYTYTVKAWDGMRWSGFDPAGITAALQDLFAAPVLTGAAAGMNGITVYWGKVPGAVSYRVYRKNGAGGWKGLGDVTGTSYTDADVASGAAYTYTVKAWNGTKWSGFDPVGITVTAHDLFTAPVLTGAAPGSDGVTVTWDEVSGAVSYRVYRRNDAGGWTGLGDVTGTSYTDADVTPGVAYTYTVKAWDGMRWSGFDPAGITAALQDLFAAPVLTGAAAGMNGITVYWGKVPGAVSYRVYRKNGAGGWKGLGDVTGTSYTDADVASGAAYTYTVKAWNGTKWSGFDPVGITVAAK